MQIAGFAVSLASCFVLSFYGLTGIVGIVLSAVGRSQAVNAGGKTGLGTAGIVIGIVSAILGFVSAVSIASMF